MKRVIGLLALGIVLGASPAWAARTRVHEMAESPAWGTKFGGMLGRGALNVVTSPVDIITNTVNESKAGPPVVGTLRGLGAGLGCGVLRLGSGAIDIVTSWVPGFNGFPVSDSYNNCFSSSPVAAMPEPAPMYESQPAPAANWDVPSTEPGAAQAPPPLESDAPKKKWKK
jgi:putative exosortase-associated protein (TIGR04073 family)